MDFGFWIHMAHNFILVVIYAVLGTVYLPGFIARLDIPARAQRVFTIFIFAFFFLCAVTHLELMLHVNELPEDYFTWSHNLFGSLQAIGAVGFTVILHPLISEKWRRTK